MKSKIAYLTSPAVGRYVLNIQMHDDPERMLSVEVSPEQMRNILVDGVTHMLRSSFHRVPTNNTNTESADDRGRA